MALLRRLLVVLVMAGAGFVPGPATAAGYCSGSGVNVVVDYGALGGGVVKDCDASGTRNAAQAFEDTGHHLTYVTTQRGFVCSVDGKPQLVCPNTPPSDAYWGLYWSDGTGGWNYASLGATALTVPAGATVAFSWQNGGDADPPGTAPAPPPAVAQPSATASTPRPTRKPTTSSPTPTKRASVVAPGSPTASATSTASVSASVTPSTSTSVSPSASDTPSLSASATSSAPDAVGEPTVSATAEDGDGGGLPWWLPVGSIVALAGAGGVVWQVRRARP